MDDRVRANYGRRRCDPPVAHPGGRDRRRRLGVLTGTGGALCAAPAQRIEGRRASAAHAHRAPRRPATSTRPWWASTSRRRGARASRPRRWPPSAARATASAGRARRRAAGTATGRAASGGPRGHVGGDPLERLLDLLQRVLFLLEVLLQQACTTSSLAHRARVGDEALVDARSRGARSRPRPRAGSRRRPALSSVFFDVRLALLLDVPRSRGTASHRPPQPSAWQRHASMIVDLLTRLVLVVPEQLHQLVVAAPLPRACPRASRARCAPSSAPRRA